MMDRLVEKLRKDVLLVKISFEGIVTVLLLFVIASS
jgi:hypothetical protein